MAKYTNKGLIKYARAMCEYNSPYWYATYGNFPADEKLYQEKKRQYPSQYEKWPKSSFVCQYGLKVHDCSGLIKGYLMSPCIDADGYVTDPLAPSVYNSKYDWSANIMIKHCSETGDISTIPNEEGLIVWKDGHVGIYDGDGYVIEERGHSYGTVRTKLSDRPFVKWGRLECIEYIKDDPQPSEYAMVDMQMPTLHLGDHCNEVSLLQTLLNVLGFRDDSGSKLKVDGDYGQKTFESVCRMQEAWNLGPDGTVGVGTWNALLHYWYK